jgi:acetyl esterase
MRTELDPQLRAVIDDIGAAGVPEWHALSVDSARRIEDEVFSAPADGEGDGDDGDATDAAESLDLVRDLSIPGPAGAIPLRAYRPAAETPTPVVVFFHGGGWTLGTLDSIDGVCRELARRAECVVVSVDYRLAPEHPFPAAVDDAYAAVEWVASHAGAFGGDPERLGVAGTSAGGNLAAAAALRATLFDGPDIAHQALLYPILDHALDTESYEENADGPLLTRADMRWFWEQYLQSPIDAHNPFAAPLRAPDLSGLPPATVVTAGFDPLRDEGVAYAEQLAAAGVSVEHRHFPSMAHGFLSLTADVDVADEAMDAVASDVRAALGC